MTQRNNPLDLKRLSPFQGPTPFTEKDKDWFFGRDRETDEVLSLILGHKLVLIYAQSGAGKTSLINSKIIPELEENGLFVFPVARVRIQESRGVLTDLTENSDGKNIKTVDIRPSSFVITNKASYNPFMYSVLQYLMTESISQDKIKDSLNPTITTLSDFLEKKLASKENKNGIGDKKAAVIIFDQLEELFRSSRDRSRETQLDFFNQIAKALEKEDLSLRVILVIREDYLAHLDPFAFVLPEKLRPRFRLDRLSKEEAREALEKPLIKAKEFFNDPKINERIDELFRKPHENGAYQSEAGMIQVRSQSLRLTESIVNNLCTVQVELPDGGIKEVLGEYVEPIYLQIVGQRLWEKLKLAPTNQITSEYLGDLGDVNIALEDFYDKAIVETAQNSKINESDIRIWCEKKLITTSGTRGSVHRGNELTVGMPNVVLDLLEDKHVIRAEMRTGGKWYELTHDRMLKPLVDFNRRWKNSLQSTLKQEKKKYNRRWMAIIVVSLILVYFMAGTSVLLLFREGFISGRSISDLAVNPATNIIYAGANNGNISVINGTTNTVIERIPLGYSNSFDLADLAVNPATNIIYAGANNGNISVINGTTNTVIERIPLGYSNSLDLAVNPATNIIYAGANNGNISVINGTTNTVIERIPLGYSNSFDLADLAVNPATNIIYAGANNGNISVINGTTNTVIERIPLGYSNSLGLLDLIDSIMERKSPAANSNSLDLAVNPATNIIYAGANNGNISVINGTTNTVIERIPLGYSNSFDLAVNPATNMVYSISRENQPNIDIIVQPIIVINGTTNKKLGFISTPHLTAITINTSKNIIFIATPSTTSRDSRILTIDGKSNIVTNVKDVY